MTERKLAEPHAELIRHAYEHFVALCRAAGLHASFPSTAVPLFLHGLEADGWRGQKLCGGLVEVLPLRPDLSLSALKPTCEKCGASCAILDENDMCPACAEAAAP